MLQKQESRQGSLYRKGKRRLLRKSIKKDEADRYAKGRCGKGMVVDPESGKCMKKPNIKKIPGVGKRNIAAREPLLDLNRGRRSKSVKSRNIARRKKATATAKKRY